MRKAILISGFVLIALNNFAQHAGGAATSGTGGFFGKITDSTGKSISDASVTVLKLIFDPSIQTYKGKLLKGFLTKSNGEFSLESIAIGEPFQIKISAIGYLPNTLFITLRSDQILKDLGNIVLSADVNQLAEVVVNTNQKLIKLDMDKITFNVEKNMVTTGGTALDLMQYIPAIQTDIDGNVKLRNAAPQIFVDGRPSTLSLDQIPADAIESIEVIANPSAKYDAAGGNAGILNLILKKNRKAGYNATFRAGINKRGSVNGGGEINIRQGKINVSGQFNGMQMNNYINGNADQRNAQVIRQVNSGKTNGTGVFGKIGLDYFVNNRTTVSFNFIKVKWQFKPEDIISSDITDGPVHKYAYRNSNSARVAYPVGFQFGYKYLFPRTGRELTADATLFSANNSYNSGIATDSANAANTVFITERQKDMSSGNSKFRTLQTDYTTPVGINGRFESGLRISLREFTNLSETFVSKNNGSFANLLNAGSNYMNKDNVYAAYAIYSGTMKNNMGFQIGLRAESSDYTGTVLSTGDKFRNRYPVSLFPSLYLTKKLKQNGQLQLNFTRRITRPNFFNLIPFIDRTDPLNYTSGNPGLKPEFTRSFNFSFSKDFKNRSNILISAYYKTTENLITRILTEQFDGVTGKSLLVNTYENAKSAYNYGVEFTSVIPVKKWWDLTVNINTYNSKINSSNITNEVLEPIWSWFGKINNIFKLPANYIIQLSADYQSKSNLPIGTVSDGGHMAQTVTAAQGYIKPFYGVDISLRKNFLKNNALSVSLALIDIFKSRWQRQHSGNAYFIQDYSRIRDPQMLRLGLAYKFGKADMSLFRRKNVKGEGETMQGTMQGSQQ